jgi:very-long-chain enoyl-CoA reductase
MLDFKDLGPQIGYRTVFLVEYFGPMLFVGLYYFRPSLIFGAGASDKPYNWVALLGVYCWMAHFLKRELETILVHKFSRPTMPLSNLYKNCTYYWSFGAVIGYPLCSPSFVPPSTILVYAGLTLFLLCEAGNLICHIMLSNLRPAEGSLERPIPSGFLFDYVSCPNYTFEVLSWVGFSLMTQIPFAYAFTLLGFIQMADWAMKKHVGYEKQYEKYKGLRRKAILPFIY